MIPEQGDETDDRRHAQHTAGGDASTPPISASGRFTMMAPRRVRGRSEHQRHEQCGDDADAEDQQSARRRPWLSNSPYRRDNPPASALPRWPSECHR
jgi:hypothetical protein